MHRTALILAAVLCSVAASAVKRPPGDVRLEIAAEYRQDLIDYDDREKRFTRERISLGFGESSATVTHVYVDEQSEHRFTAALALEGLSPYFDCVAGHYYTTFGAGLVAGKKTYASPDPFTRSPVIARSAPFAPCTGGSPAYCFQGLAGGIIIPGETVSLAVRGFFSCRDRFVRTDTGLPDVTGTSLGSILARRTRDYRYAEPVSVMDFGGVIDVRLADRLTMQAYFIQTEIRHAIGRPLLWSYGERRLPLGDRAFYACGFFAEYRDDYIRMFIEIGLPARIAASLPGTRGTIRDYGLVYGLAFTHGACAVTFTGKTCGNDFYTPYGAGGSYAESSWMVGMTLRPVRGLTLSASFYAEKKKSAGATLSYLPLLKREVMAVRYSFPGVARCSVRVTTLQEERKSGPESALQIRSSAGVYIRGSILLSASGTARRGGNGRWSGSAGTGLTLCLIRCVCLSVSYARFFVPDLDPLYVPSGRGRGAISTGRYVTSSSHALSCRLALRWRGFGLTGRYRYGFEGGRTLEHRFEASCRITF